MTGQGYVFLPILEFVQQSAESDFNKLAPPPTPYYQLVHCANTQILFITGNKLNFCSSLIFLIPISKYYNDLMIRNLPGVYLDG